MSTLEIFAAFHEQPTFLPWTGHILNNVIPTILVTAINLTILFNILYYLLQSYVPAFSDPVRRQASYQLTNLIINAFLGSLGWYHFTNTLPDAPTMDEMVIGWESLYIISSIQVGYQLWSIVMGLCFVKESPAMIAHHVALVVTSFMACFMTMGFRYWTPFLYGVVELSSVPLSVMNFFKDNPKWMQHYPTQYFYVRLTFAISFLTVRWFMFMPRAFSFLRQVIWAIQSSNSTAYITYMSLVWLGTFFLACLQLYWGILIVKGLKNAFFPKRKKQT